MARRGLAVMLVGMIPSLLRGQRIVSSIDVSGTGIWYADTIHSAGTAVSPTARIDWRYATLGATGTLSQLGSGGTSLQASLSPSVFTPSWKALTMEFAATVGGSTHQDGTHTGQGIGLARAYYMNGGAGVWVGAGAGSTWDGAAWRDVRQTELGAFVQRASATALGTVTPVIVQDTIRYTDWQAALRVPAQSWEFGAQLGARSGSVGAVVGGTSRVWGNFSVTNWLTPRLAVVATGGTYPVDLTQGFPGGKFISLALRIGSRASRASDTSPSVAPRSADSGAETGFQVVSSGDVRTIRVYAPGASHVELNADFTHWRAASLASSGNGWWTMVMSVRPGVYHLNVRVDGGAWIVPSGLLAESDEFGGSVGILQLR